MTEQRDAVKGDTADDRDTQVRDDGSAEGAPQAGTDPLGEGDAAGRLDAASTGDVTQGESDDRDSSDDSAADFDDDSDDDSDAEDEDDEDDEDVDDDAAPAPAAAGRARGRRAPSPERTEQLEREGDVAADFLERLLDIADLDGDIDVDIDGDRASVAIVDSDEGRVPRRLVGPNGRVLEALQELTRMAVQAATGERSRLMLDVADHRAHRRQEVLTITRAAIDDVRSSGQPASLAPMTAFERKVAHDEVLAAGLVSESEGTEPSRHVVVLPA